MKLGIVQMSVVDSIAQNLKTASKYVQLLCKKGAQIVVLPEMFCCPYDNESFPVYAQPAGGSIYCALQHIAKTQEVYLVAGSMPEKEENRIYNTCFVFDPNGLEIAKHRKVHLFDINIEEGQRFRESDTLTAGKEVTVFDTPYGTIGLCICFDMRFPELARLMALRGAQIILVPAAFNRTTGPMHWELMFRSRAVDNQVFTAGIAPAQNMDAKYISYGHSLVVSPWGNVLKSADTAEEAFVVDIDFREVQRVRRELPLLSARREDVYRGGFSCDA